MTSGYDQLEMIADFFNTQDRRTRYEGDPGIEHLIEPTRLVEWLLRHQLLAEPDDAASEEELQLARELRNELRKTIVNNEHDGNVEQVKLEQLTKNFQFGLVFQENGEQLVPLQVNAAKGLAQLLIIVYELRRTKMWHRIRVCTAEDCQWVFVDRSRPGTGRWCSMKACGNRAKNKTFRHKHKYESSL
ncbi:CGNR zinc finger domain-containing protein [Paenibacillus alvei]|uniref:CGNR zinc finger domain-containing protein n=1 Tax=Paenibacillus alvei TaxID=44250 RepID=UPI00227F9A89|nr:CGNR zinc finger domain-containing protein [Paenibacillus alvei]